MIIKYIIFNLIGVIIVVSLVFLVVNFTTGLPWNKKQIVTEDRPVSSFNSIVYEGIGDLNISQGQKESLNIEGDEDVLKNISTIVENNVLKINYKNNNPFSFLSIPLNKNIKINITSKDLKNITLSGAMTLNIDNFNTDMLNININGASKANMNIETNNFSGDISGAGSIEIKGKTINQSVKLNGAGSYSSYNFTSVNADIDISGAGSAQINATDKLKANISGAGNIKYKGNPEVTKNVSGLGNIEKSD